MRAMRLLTVIAVGLVLAAVAGCARTQVMANRPLDTDLGRYAALTFWTESAVTEDISKEMSSLEEQVLERMEKLGAFQTVRLGEEPDPAEGTLLVKATINQIRKVSGTARFFIGAFAGRASITVEVVIIDGGTGEAIGSYTVTGESGGSAMSGGTDDAVKKTAQGIADLIEENT